MTSKMLPLTDMSKVKAVAKLLFEVMPIKMDEMGLCSHPYTTTVLTGGMKDGKPAFLILTDKDDYNLWKELVFKHIEEAKELSDFYVILNKAYYLTFLKLCKEANCLSIKDFSSFLADAFTTCECPCGDANVSIRELLNYFSIADKNHLMDDDENQVYDSLPEVVTVYRGVSPQNNPKGVSYTISKEKAEWFRDRWKNLDGERFIISANIPKKYVLAFFNRREEDEVIVNVPLAKRHGVEFLQNAV